VRNNSILITSRGTGIQLNTEGTNHTVVSNAIRYTGSNTGWNCLRADLPASSYTAIDNNVCGYSVGEWADGVGNLAAWQSAGWGTNSQAADPGFTSSANLAPAAATSAIVNAGHPSLSATRDFYNNSRDALPDAGAYEWVFNGTPPNISLDVTGTLGTNGWYITPPTITVTASDDTSGIASVSLSTGGTSTTITTEGSTTITGTAINNAGISATASITVLYDASEPTISPQISGPVTNGTYPANLTISVNGSDAVSGIASELIQIDGSGWVSPGAYTLSGGTHTIEFQAIDNAGHSVSSSQTITVDAEPSVVTISSSGCGPTIAFSGTATDPNGVADVSINIDGTAYPVTFGGGAWSYTAYGLNSGVHSATAFVTDTNGNIASASTAVTVDVTSPTISMASSLTQYTATTLTITDDQPLSQVGITISVTHNSSQIFNQAYSGTNYPDIISWGVLIPSYTAPYGDQLDINVQAVDACSNNASASAVMTVVQPSPTPTDTPPPPPTKTPTVTPTPSKTLTATNTSTVTLTPAESSTATSTWVPSPNATQIVLPALTAVNAQEVHPDLETYDLSDGMRRVVNDIVEKFVKPVSTWAAANFALLCILGFSIPAGALLVIRALVKKRMR
jgi:hypothetical protein